MLKKLLGLEQFRHLKTKSLLKRINSIQGNDCVNFLKVSSNYFIVHGLVKIDKVIFNGSSLLDRTSGKTRLLWSRM